METVHPHRAGIEGRRSQLARAARYVTERAAGSARAAGLGLLLLLSGCSAGTVELPSVSMPKLPEAKPDAPPPPPETGVAVPASATVIYSRLALGANSCWFGHGGWLKQDYVYFADADAPSRGGKAMIVIHQRDPTQPNPRGLKAYRVNIDPDGETASRLKIENLRMPEVFAAAMARDIDRWAAGDQGCQGVSTANGWGAGEATAAAKSAKAKADARKAGGKKAKAAP